MATAYTTTRRFISQLIRKSPLDRIRLATKPYRVRLKTRTAFPGNMLPPLSLHQIGKATGTDKHDLQHSFNDLSYLDVYAKYLDVLRDQPIKLLELGVKDGASLSMWDRYFLRGQIFGIDIDPRCAQFERGRIQVAIGSQADREFLKTAFGDVTFDVILDDASHVNTLTKTSLESLFARLAPGGLYIIEDLGCSYVKLESVFQVRETWPGMKYNASDMPLDNDRSLMEELFNALIHDLDRRTGAVRFVHFWSQVVVIGKTV